MMRLALLVSAFLSTGVLAQPSADELRRAEDAYGRALELLEEDRPAAEALLEEAGAIWLRAEAEGARNADLQRNIGNAALLRGDLGRAVLAYRRALELRPDDARARQSLEVARRQTRVEWPDPSAFGPAGWLGSAGSAIPPLVGLLSALGGWMLVWIAIGVRRGTIGRGWMLGLGLTALVGGGLLGLLGGLARATPTNAVLLEATRAFRGPSEAVYEEAFDAPIPAGTELVALEWRGDWVECLTPTGDSYWIPGARIEQIANRLPD